MSSLEYPFASLPEPGTSMEVAPGVRWLRMPLPFQLNHINLWLLEDAGGWTIVDTGIGNPATRELWERVFASLPGTVSVKRIVLTHYHPDHAGNAAWLCERFGVEIWTTQGEYLTAHAVRSAGAGYTGDAVLAVFQKNGLDAERRAAMDSRGKNRYAELVPDFPHAYRRVIDGERLRIGGRQWRAIVGYGHAPEHLSLYCEELNVLIAGDMLLSTISTNVSVWSVDPEGDPLRLFLESIARYRELPADVLVLPSHGKPFRGAHTRVAELEAHHQERFAELMEALKGEARSAAELMPVLFRRPLDAHQTFFAMGEAIAHLHYLYYAGRASRAAGADGVMRYARA
jgi:glyoxylase-like metal-dependent hydrolase (beta-lactamase superfamily II)